MKVALLYLMSEVSSKNEFDEPIKTYTKRKVIGREKSISQTEFYQAQAVGFKPEIKFSVHAFEYKGEKKLAYKNEVYGIKRTYEDSGDVELTCSKEVNQIGGGS